MKTYLLLSCLFFLVGTVAFKQPTLPVDIVGHLRKNIPDTSVHLNHMHVFVKGSSRVLAKTMTDRSGNFELIFTPTDEKSFQFYCYGQGIDTILIASFRSFYSDTPEISFSLPLSVKKNRLGQVICPVCWKADKLKKVLYADERSATDSASVNYYKTVRLKGIASYYCARDKAYF